MWKISIKGKAEKTLNSLDKPIKDQIIKYFDKITFSGENPKSFSKPLLANRKGLWCYRVGDYRIICSIEEKELLILVLDLGHRSRVYV